MCVVIVSADNALRSPLFVVIVVAVVVFVIMVVVVVVVLVIMVVVVVDRIIAIGLIKFPRLMVEFSQVQRNDGLLRPVATCDNRETVARQAFLETILATIHFLAEIDWDTSQGNAIKISVDFRLDFRPSSEKIDLDGATEGTSIVNGSREEEAVQRGTTLDDIPGRNDAYRTRRGNISRNLVVNLG